MKECTVCKEIKSLGEFYNRKASDDGKAYRCKECDNKAGREYKKKHKERFSTLNKHRVRRFKYGIEPEDYNKMVHEQNGKCAICETDLDFSREPDDHGARAVIDHCHMTNKVRGLLCARCNQALGLFKDDVDALKRAIRYLNDIH